MIVVGFIQAINPNNPEAASKAAKQQRKSSIRDPIVWATIGIVFATVFTGGVGYLQYLTLEKTDQTLRAGQRAFVFLEGIHMTQHAVLPNGYSWYFVASLQNNGTTQTKNLVTRLTCKINPQHSDIGTSHSLLGPKQIDGAGACTWSADQLAQIWQNQSHIFMAGDAVYYDVFDDRHITRFCRDITIQSDPRIGNGTLQQVTGVCPDWPDCADKECEQSASNLPPPEGSQK